MKTLLALFLLSLSSFASAEVCTSVIKDYRSNYEYETFTRSSYLMQAACDQAMFDCNGVLANARANGRYYDAQCELKYVPSPNPYPDPRPNPNPSRLICQTDLLDNWNSIVRSFTAPGQTEWEACSTSDQFCKVELARGNSRGVRCVNRGLIGGHDPRPPRTKTEQYIVERRDPAGMFIQRYITTVTGPINTDVKGEACRQALGDCSRELRGRQTCSIGF